MKVEDLALRLFKFKTMKNNLSNKKYKKKKYKIIIGF